MRRHASATSLAFALLGLTLPSSGCSTPHGFWRDQYVFVGDEGTTLPLSVLRWSEGHAEVKGWLGEGGRWRSSFHRRFAIAGRDAPDLERTLRVFSAQTGPSARVTLEAPSSDGLRLRLRTPSRDMRLSTSGLRPLGEGVDPEGASSYAAGRGTLRSGSGEESGWILRESTPRERPKRDFVAYGDYALVMVASAEHGALVLKRSLDVTGFDRALVTATLGTRETTEVRALADEEHLRVTLPALNLEITSTIDDRRLSHGVAPGGHAVSYETLLLSGDYRGVAFLIHRRAGGSP